LHELQIFNSRLLTINFFNKFNTLTPHYKLSIWLVARFCLESYHVLWQPFRVVKHAAAIFAVRAEPVEAASRMKINFAKVAFDDRGVGLFLE
jgi:hypothetical protein